VSLIPVLPIFHDFLLNFVFPLLGLKACFHSFMHILNVFKFLKLGYDIKGFLSHHLSFPSFEFSNLSKWKGRYKNSVILAAPGVMIVLHVPPSRDRVLTLEIIARGSTYLYMIYFRL
jgi:hypothetical protein